MLARRFDKWKILWFTFCKLRKVDEKEVDEVFTLVGSGDTCCLLLSELQRKDNCENKEMPLIRTLC